MPSIELKVDGVEYVCTPKQTNTGPQNPTNPTNPKTPVVPPVGVIPELINLPISTASYKGEQKRMLKNEVKCYKFARADLIGRTLVIQNAQYGVGFSLAISNKPGDFGADTGGVREGLINTLGGRGAGEKTMMPNNANTPPDIDGHLYVNLRWTAWDNFAPHGKLVNFCTEDSGTFVIRRD